MRLYASHEVTMYYKDFVLSLKNAILEIIDDISASKPSKNIIDKLEYLRNSITKRSPGYTSIKTKEIKIKHAYDNILSIIDNIIAGVGLSIVKIRLLYIADDLVLH